MRKRVDQIEYDNTRSLLATSFGAQSVPVALVKVFRSEFDELPQVGDEARKAALQILKDSDRLVKDGYLDQNEVSQINKWLIAHSKSQVSSQSFCRRW